MVETKEVELKHIPLVEVRADYINLFFTWVNQAIGAMEKGTPDYDTFIMIAGDLKETLVNLNEKIKGLNSENQNPLTNDDSESVESTSAKTE